MAKAMYDPWSKIVTKNGYAGDEVISALQNQLDVPKKKMHVCLLMKCIFLHHNY